MSDSAAKSRPRGVYTASQPESMRSTWTRIGTAWTNRDGSITLRLDALPVSGVLTVRDLPAETKGSAR